MPDRAYHIIGHAQGAEVGVQSALDGQNILVEHGALGQRLACLLGSGKEEIVRQGDAYYWCIVHNRQVDDLLVELIDFLISIRYAHPTMVQLELALSESEAMILEPDEP